MLLAQDTILFQGDSITDGGRVRDRLTGLDPAPLGHGYVFLIAGCLSANHPEMGLTFLNRGINGHTVSDLADRWDRDALAMRPDVLSILVGVNDHRYPLTGWSSGVPIPEYESIYRRLLEQARAANPRMGLVLGEPFMEYAGEVDRRYGDQFQERRAVVRKLAQEYQAAFVPYQSVFDDACAIAPIHHWLVDGIHPTPAGNWLMAQAWIKTTQAYQPSC